MRPEPSQATVSDSPPTVFRGGQVSEDRSMRIPTADEINVYDSLDERWALKNFLGKTLEEAEALFRENDIFYLGDLLWMGPKAFCYYVVAAIHYLKSDSSEGRSDAVNWFQGSVESRLRDDRGELATAIPDLRSAVQFILDHWEKFDVSPGIYGNLKGKYDRLLRELTR